MRILIMSLILAVGSMGPSPPGYAQHRLNSQLSQAPTDDFDGQWVGFGGGSSSKFRSKCADGPIIELTLRGRVAKATLKLVLKKTQEIDIEVIALRGAIDEQGNLSLAGYESKLVGVLSASEGTGEGTWDIVTYGCRGSFRLRKKSSQFSWPQS